MPLKCWTNTNITKHSELQFWWDRNQNKHSEKNNNGELLPGAGEEGRGAVLISFNCQVDKA